MKNRYIYLIQALDTGYYKIGISIHPEKRLQTHQTGNAGRLRMCSKQIFEHASQIETALKNQYSHLKKEGEWFELSLSQELSFIGDCSKIEDRLRFLKAADNVFI